MRLHSLELAAIGPFASVQQIDFEQLQSSGLFLLDGPTGAGKTTVLDAITFALYGPGENRGDGRLHSDFAAPDAEPFVTLEFSLRGVRYRLRRTPEYERPKRRGDGVTVAHATAHLERFESGGWVSRSSNKAEIAEIVDDELGLTREQFHQVVLLPQGDFATFLRANDDERRGVLSRLFGTGLYQRVTDELDARRAQAAREITAAAEAVTTGIAVAAEAAGLDPGDRDELCALAADERSVRLNDIGAALATLRGDAEDRAAQSATAVTAARAAFDAASAAAAALRRFVAVQSERTGHYAVAGKVDVARTKLRDAVRAEPVRALLADVPRPIQALSSRAVEAALTTARELARDGTVAAGRRPALQAKLDAGHAVAELEPRAATALRTATAAVDAHQGAADEHLRLLEARLAGMAAELAGGLADGEPCAVCGATSHPAPATVAAGAVDAADVRAAQARRDTAQRERTEAERAAAEAQQALAAASSVAGGESVETLAADLAALDVTIDAGERASAAEAELTLALARAKAAEAAQAEAGNAGFESLDAAVSAVLAPDARGDLEQRVAAWDQKAASLDAALNTPEFAHLRGLAPAEVETSHADAVAAELAARDSLERAEAARASAVADTDRTHRAAARFADRLADLAAAEARLAALEAESATVIHLAKLTRGMAGHRRVALTTYVLRHWFEHVVDAANARLSSISSGRYSLVRVDEGESKSERTGLTLNVIDTHTGEARTPRSLSGGETFYTSLALALGLADVVKAEAGGVDLDTLFIDEGFGTLDSDTLEQVMSVIDELRDRGRVVGIVSHVADLKERIPERLEVRRLPDGSSTLKVVA